MKGRVYKMMESKNDQSILEQMELDTNYEIIKLEECENGDNHRILNDAKEEIMHLFNEFHKWLNENMHSIEKSERLAKLKMDIANIVSESKQKLIEFPARSDVQRGTRKVLNVTSKLANSVSNGVNEIKNSEPMHKVIDSINETFDCVKNDERVKHNVKKLKKGTLKVAECAFNGLKRVLDTDDENQKG